MPGSGVDPRGGRGSQRWQSGGCQHDGSIPAWAGEPAPTRSRPRRCKVDPRVGGGARQRSSKISAIRGRSPRGRGSPELRVAGVDPLGSIPAWAGEPLPQQRAPAQCGVDPRVGGGASGPQLPRNHSLVKDRRSVLLPLQFALHEQQAVNFCELPRRKTKHTDTYPADLGRIAPS